MCANEQLEVCQLPQCHCAGCGGAHISGIYYKRLGAAMDPSEQTLAAVLHLYPSATLCGATVLHRNGWTTQIPRSIQVAIEERPSLVQLHGVDLL